MNKFELIRTLLLDNAKEVNHSNAQLFVLVSVLSESYRAGGIQYLCSPGQSLLDEVIAQVAVHSTLEADRMRQTMHGFGPRMTGPCSAVGFGAIC